MTTSIASPYDSLGLFRLAGWRGRSLDVGLGAIAVLGLAPFHLWLVAMLCLAALKLRLDRAPTPRAGFGRGFWFGLGFFGAGLFWVGAAFIARGPAYIPLMPPMVLGLAVLLAVFWAVAARIYVQCAPRPVWSIFLFTALFSLAELARGHVLSGLPWNLTGYIFEAGQPVSQIAALIGIYGLTTLTFLMAAGLSTTLEKRWAGLCLTLVIFAGLYAYGYNRLRAATLDYVDGAKLRIVQVPFDQSDKFDPEKSVAIINRFLIQSMAPGLEDVTHVIWPEGAVNGRALENQALINAMANALLSVDATPPHWLLNSLRHETRPLNNGAVQDIYYNTSAVISFSPAGVPTLARFNDKSKLVPFGEFIPLGTWIQTFGVETLSTAVASISPATQKRNARFPGLPPLSPQICYEIIFPGLTPQQSDPAPQWILNQSNDAWYGQSIGPHQHFNQARYRAIEEGLPIVRAASNGFSGIIDPYGRVDSGVGPRAETALDVLLPRPVKHKVNISRINLYLLLINLIASILCINVGCGPWRKSV